MSLVYSEVEVKHVDCYATWRKSRDKSHTVEEESELLTIPGPKVVILWHLQTHLRVREAV